MIAGLFIRMRNLVLWRVMYVVGSLLRRVQKHIMELR